MATGTKADFKVYNEFIHTGLTETLQQAAAGIAAASNGALRMTAVSRRGDFVYESMFKSISGLISRRITEGTGSTSTVTDTALQQLEDVSVKINRKVGPVANTLDSFRKLGQTGVDENAMNLVLGQQTGVAMQVDMLNTALRATKAALNAQSAVKSTVASSGTLDTVSLVDGLAKFGDRADRIVAWVMHSKPYFDLTKSQIVANIDGVSNFVVANASPVTLNRPVVVTDSDALLAVSGSPAVTDYYTLGLTVGATTVEDSEEDLIYSEIVTGAENLIVRYQGEFAYNLGVKGFTWDVSNGGKNPTDTAIGTGSNWDVTASSYKDYAGILVQSR